MLLAVHAHTRAPRWGIVCVVFGLWWQVKKQVLTKKRDVCKNKDCRVLSGSMRRDVGAPVPPGTIGICFTPLG